jgi:hypothetical protein
VTTMVGEPLAPCMAITRPWRSVSVVHRSTHTSTPRAWYSVVGEWLTIPKTTRQSKNIWWDTWQGISSSNYTEVIGFRQKVLLWPTLPDNPSELFPRLPCPAEMMKLYELLLLERRWTLEETVIVEEALLRHVTKDGQWF